MGAKDWSLGLVVLALLGCSTGPTAVRTPAPPTKPVPRAPEAVWPVPWVGSFNGRSELSRDGRLAVVRVYTRGERQPFLYRVAEPAGPLRELSELVPGFPVAAAWAPDSKELALLCETSRDAKERELAVVDLESNRVAARIALPEGDGDDIPFGFVAGAELVFALRDYSLGSYDARRGVEVARRAERALGVHAHRSRRARGAQSPRNGPRCRRSCSPAWTDGASGSDARTTRGSV